MTSKVEPMRVLAIIPAHNEQDCIEDTVRSLTQACPEIDYLVVNDGSTDATAAICREQGFNHIDLPVNTGLASGFQAGMKYAYRHGYDAAVQFDADGQHLPAYLPVMAEALEHEHANVVIASRFLTEKKDLSPRMLGSRLITWLIRVTTGTTITDPTSGMRMYDRDLIRTYATSFDLAPEPDAIALICRRGGTVVEVPATMQERQGGESYFTLPSVARYMARTCLSILMFQWFR